MMHVLIAVITVAALWAWTVAHQLIIYYFLSVTIDQLPKPSGNNAFYTYLFGVTHVIAANWNRAKMGITTKPLNGPVGPGPDTTKENTKP